MGINVNDINEVIEIGHPYHSEIPHHHLHNPFLYSMSRMHGDVNYLEGVTTANDLITTGTHTGTHIDALGHVSCCGMMYGDVPVEGNQSKTKGLTKNGIDEVKPIIVNAKLIDLTLLDDLYIENGKVTIDMVENVLGLTNIQINAGDAVFFRTGLDEKFSNASEFLTIHKAPGPTLETVEYLIRKGMSLTGSDTMAYEYMNGNQLPVHKRLLVGEGINIIEMLNFQELSQKKRYEFVFVCLPLRIIGATGSPIRPIAII